MAATDLQVGLPRTLHHSRNCSNTVDDCPNIPRGFVERERREKPAADFLEDYYCVFQDSSQQIFATDDVDTAFRDDVKPLFESNSRVHGTTRLHYYIGIDLGQRRDHTAVAVLERHSFNTGESDLATAAWTIRTTLQLRHLEMMPLQTPYHDVIQRLSNLVSREPLNGNATMVLDAGAPDITCSTSSGRRGSARGSSPSR